MRIEIELNKEEVALALKDYITKQQGFNVTLYSGDVDVKLYDAGASIVIERN